MFRVRRKQADQKQGWINWCTAAGIEPNAVVYLKFSPTTYDDFEVYTDISLTNKIRGEWFGEYFEPVKKCVNL